jgi:hypothetical protein
MNAPLAEVGVFVAVIDLPTFFLKTRDNAIREYSHMSSNSILQSQHALSDRLASGDKLGLATSGGGFTFAAELLRLL